MSQLSLSGKVIAITGAASGIGFATAQACASCGASLALADINITALESALSTLKSTHPDLNATATALNVTDSPSVDAWHISIVTHFGRLDGAANIAGVETLPGQTPYKKIVDVTDDHWRFVQDVNVNGVFYCVRAQLKIMAPGGSIVNAASTAGLSGSPRFAAYGASKHAVVGLTKCAAGEAGEQGVRVNAVCPGPVDTPLLRRMCEGNEAQWKSLEQRAYLGRMGAIDEIAKTFCYLLSDESSWVNGTTITVNGGASSN